MRKNIQLLLVIIFFISGIYAADNYGEIGTPANEPDSTAFQVKAFRIYEEEKLYANLVITNAMSSGLDRVNEGGAITISDHYLERYMGIVNGIDDPITSFSEHAIFSYRVEGNGKGNFTIKLDFQPFYLVGANTPTDTQWIRNAFELANETYEFNSTDFTESNYGVGKSFDIPSDPLIYSSAAQQVVFCPCKDIVLMLTVWEQDPNSVHNVISNYFHQYLALTFGAEISGDGAGFSISPQIAYDISDVSGTVYP